MLTEFAFIVKAGLCSLLNLLIGQKFSSDDELGKIWVLLEHQE